MTSAPLSQRIIPEGKTRDAIRTSLLTGLAFASQGRTDAALSQPRVQNLYLHFLPPKDEARFTEAIDALAMRSSFATYSDAASLSVAGAPEEPTLSISFDDGFATNLRAAEILAEKGISACFFICPELIGMTRAELLPYFGKSLGQEQRSLTWQEVERLLELGHEIGSHTLTHPILAELPLQEGIRQIRESKRQLEARVGSIRHFAWPCGQFHHFTSDLANEVFAAGYDTCASAVRGAHRLATAPSELCIRREHWVTDWPLSHLLYLMGRSVRADPPGAGRWPADWRVQGP